MTSSNYQPMSGNDDTHIINLIKSGNHQAYAILVDRYKNMIYSLCLKIIRNNEDAEEAAQDAFIKAFKNIEKFKGNSKFSTWLYKVTYNTCLDVLKKGKKEKKVITVEHFKPNELNYDTAFDEFTEGDIQQNSILRCIELLPPDERLIVSLFYYDNQSLDEIASIVALKPNHVKVKLHRIRKKLAVLLKDKLEPNLIAYYERDRR